MVLWDIIAMATTSHLNRRTPAIARPQSIPLAYNQMKGKTKRRASLENSGILWPIQPLAE